MAQDGGRACQGRSGSKHSPGVKSQLEEPQRGSQTFPSLAGGDAAAAGTDNNSLQNDTVPAAEPPKGSSLEHFFQPAAASQHRVNKVIPELPWQEEPPTGTRPAPALAGPSGCQGIESPRKLQYDSLNYTNCVSWYWGRINTVFLMLDFINTIGFSLTLRNCISQFLQTISHQLCSFRFADDW